MAFKITQKVTVVGTKLKDLNLIPNTHIVVGEIMSHKLSFDPICVIACHRQYTKQIIKKLNVVLLKVKKHISKHKISYQPSFKCI